MWRLVHGGSQAVHRMHKGLWTSVVTMNTRLCSSGRRVENTRRLFPNELFFAQKETCAEPASDLTCIVPLLLSNLSISCSSCTLPRVHEANVFFARGESPSAHKGQGQELGGMEGASYQVTTVEA